MALARGRARISHTHARAARSDVPMLTYYAPNPRVLRDRSGQNRPQTRVIPGLAGRLDFRAPLLIGTVVTTERWGGFCAFQTPPRPSAGHRAEAGSPGACY